MNELNFSTGIKTFTVNGGMEISFNPLDRGFVSQILGSMESIDKIRADYEEKCKAAEGTAEIFMLNDRMDADIRDILDGIFGHGTSLGVFGKVPVNSLADGLPLWMNFLMAVLDTVEAEAQSSEKAAQSRLSKYEAKYGKYMKK